MFQRDPGDRTPRVRALPAASEPKVRRWQGPGLRWAAESRVALGLLFLMGCGGLETPEDYADARARAECSRIQSCELGRFEDDYSSEEGCFNERSDEIGDNGEDLDERGCTYLPDEAAACVSRIRGLSCEDWFEGESGLACDLVWDCTDREGEE